MRSFIIYISIVEGTQNMKPTQNTGKNLLEKNLTQKMAINMSPHMCICGKERQ